VYFTSVLFVAPSISSGSLSLVKYPDIRCSNKSLMVPVSVHLSSCN
jgi:hypothetical protein